MKTLDFQRRCLLRGLAAAGGLSAAGWPAFGTAATPVLDIQEVTDRFTVISGAGGNVVLYQGDDSVTVIDSGRAEYAGDLAAAIKGLAGSTPVKYLVNTHWHEGHCGGNAAIRALGATIIAHENTRLWLGADFDVEWRHDHFDPRPEADLPDDTFYDSTQRDLSGAWVHLLHFPQAHTDGDLAVYFPESNVLVAGGLVTDNRYPVCDIATGGWIGGLVDADKGLLEIINDSTVIIPGEGNPRTTNDLKAQLAMLENLYGQMKALAQDGYSGHDMLKARITKDYDDQWGDPTEFVLETYRGMWAHTYDMGGFI